MLLFVITSLHFSLFAAQICPETPNLPHCPYFNNREVIRNADTATLSVQCPWYSPDTCCMREESERIVAGVANTLLQDTSPSCRHQLNLLVCYVCSPNQSQFYLPGELVICRDFCEMLFTSCSNSVWKGQLLGERFKNSSDFCLSRGYTIGNSPNLPDCFNSGVSLASNFWTVMACLCLFMLTGDKFRWKLLVTLMLLATVRVTEGRDLSLSVKEWANSLSHFTSNMTEQILQVEKLQESFYTASYDELEVNGSRLRDEMALSLSEIYREVTEAVEQLVNSTQQLFKANCTNPIASQYSSQDGGEFYDADTDNYFPPNSSSVKISDTVDRAELMQEIRLTSNLTNTFQNINHSSRYIRKQYFGSARGFLREFPGRAWDRDFVGFPREYDPRLQSWYHVASSRPKDIVIIVDCSSSMQENNRWSLALSTIETLLQTLTQEDFINIICSHSSAYPDQTSPSPDFIDARVVGSCSLEGLMPATNGVKRSLMRKMRAETPKGGSDHRDAFTLAFKLFSTNPRSCGNPLILFITDGQDSDPVFCRAAAYFGTEEGALFVPPPRCRYNQSEVLEHVENLATWEYGGNGVVRIFGFAITDQATSLPLKLSSRHGGSSLVITGEFGIYSQISAYLKEISRNTSELKFLNPYGGRDGQLILTAVSPVHSWCSGEMVGVVGVDYSLEDVQSVLSRARSESSYAFIINQFGEALFHPRIDPIARFIPNPIHPPLSSLETCPNNSNISICAENPVSINIEARVLATTNTDTFRVPNIPRLTLRGDYQDGVEWTLGNSNYFYARIDASPFILGLNLDDSFLKQLVLQQLPPNETYVLPYYNIFSQYPDQILSTFGLELPKFCPTTSPFNVSTNQSLVVLAPISTCDPTKFEVNQIPGPLIVYDYFRNFMDTNRTKEFEGCENENYFIDRILQTVLLTSPRGDKWRLNNESGIVWRYIGLENGVFRIFPGLELGTNYNPTVRPWYRRAVAERDRLALSYVYLDAGGAGKTVTFSKVVYKSRNSTGIAGVTAFDYTYDEFSSTIRRDFKLDNYSCTNNCFYLFDSQTFLILADEILNVSSFNTSAYERLSLGSLHPEIVRDLVDNKGFLVEEVSFDFQSSCRYSPYFVRTMEVNMSVFLETGSFPPFEDVYSCVQSVRNFYVNQTMLKSVNSEVIAGTILKNNGCQYGDYYLSAINGTNAYLLVLNDWTRQVNYQSDTSKCPIGKSGPTEDLTGGTQCAALFSQIQLSSSYNCSSLIYFNSTVNSASRHTSISNLIGSLTITLLVFLSL